MSDVNAEKMAVLRKELLKAIGESKGGSVENVWGTVDLNKLMERVKNGKCRFKSGSVKEKIVRELVEKFEHGEVFSLNACRAKKFEIKGSEMSVDGNLRWYKAWIKENCLN